MKMFLILLILSMKNAPNRFASDFLSAQDGRVETWDLPNTLLNIRHNFLPYPLFSLTKSYSIVPYSCSGDGYNYLLSKAGTVSGRLFPPPSLFILSSQTLCNFELISYPAGCRFGETPSFQGSMNISEIRQARYILFMSVSRSTDG